MATLPHIPVLSPAGTTKTELIAKLSEAKQTILMAAEAIIRATPKECDYTEPPNFRLAMRIFNGRLNNLQLVIDDLNADMEAIADMQAP